MDVEIKRTANLAPAMIADPSWECANHKSCAKVWKRLWPEQIGRKLLHPMFSLKPQEMLWNVQKFQHPGFTLRWLKGMCDQIHDGTLLFDERVVNATAHAIIKVRNIPEN
ncbi:hypothetical protein B0H14DRAFT_3534335 [Mycena olivaceomarginata]|nr:hypothetical protein B0H14DRAFT_3534335 [Mycena olivaceomarginata]